MKKVFLLFTSIALTLLLLSCSNSSSSSSVTYKIEVGAVSKSTTDVALDMVESYGTNINHSNIKTIRDYLYKNTVSDYDSTGRVTTDEIRDFLTSKGMTTTQANMEIAVLETLGNDIVFFEHMNYSDLRVWMYAEQE